MKIHAQLLPLLLLTPLAALPAVEPIPAFTSGARILFQGDSITDGNRGRNADPNHLLGHGYAFIIAARHGAAFPAAQLDFMNRGVSGNTVLDLAKRWKADTLDLQPSLLSVLIGVNDAGKNVPLDEYEQTYDRLLTDARAANANIRLVLCEPFMLAVGEKADAQTERRENVKQRQAIVEKLAAKHHAAVVHFQRVFDEACTRAPAEHWIWDGVHPTYSGHQLMADEWERVVREFWK